MAATAILRKENIAIFSYSKDDSTARTSVLLIGLPIVPFDKRSRPIPFRSVQKRTALFPFSHCFSCAFDRFVIISSQKNVARLVVACFTAGGVPYRSDPAHLLFHWPFLEYEHWDVAHTRTYSCHHLSSSSARRGRERLSRCFAELQFSQGTHPTPVSRQASQKQRARQCIISSFLKLFFVCY